MRDGSVGWKCGVEVCGGVCEGQQEAGNGPLMPQRHSCHSARPVPTARGTPGAGNDWGGRQQGERGSRLCYRFQAPSQHRVLCQPALLQRTSHRPFSCSVRGPDQESFPSSHLSLARWCCPEAHPSLTNTPFPASQDPPSPVTSAPLCTSPSPGTFACPAPPVAPQPRHAGTARPVSPALA